MDVTARTSSRGFISLVDAVVVGVLERHCLVPMCRLWDAKASEPEECLEAQQRQRNGRIELGDLKGIQAENQRDAIVSRAGLGYVLELAHVAILAP